MKLSEVLKDWPEKKQWYYPELSGPNEFERKLGQTKIDTWNESLTSCDREIDREALVKILLEPSKSQDNNINFGVVNAYKARYLTQAIISTMPTWLKPTERK